jgi:hypothetical protein
MFERIISKVCDFWGFMFRVTKFIFTFNLPEFKVKIKTRQAFVCMIPCVTLLRSIVLGADLYSNA